MSFRDFWRKLFNRRRPPRPAPAPTPPPTPTPTPIPPPVTPPITPSPPTPPAAQSPTGVAGTWNLVFSDDFTGTTLDTSKWQPYWWDPTMSDNNGVSTPAANTTVSGGNLVLTLSDSSHGACVVTQPSSWSGSNPGFAGFTLGGDSVFEAGILFPGDGTRLYNWPAFWVLNDHGANVEIDIAEVLGGTMTANYHGAATAPQVVMNDQYYGDQFHVYTCHRTASKLYFYIDGALKGTMTVNSGTAPLYILLNIGVGQGSKTVTGPGGAVKVDYVRAWN